MKFLAGLLFAVPVGLSFYYGMAPAVAPTADRADGTGYVWTCTTDLECEIEAARRGLPVDRD